MKPNYKKALEEIYRLLLLPDPKDATNNSEEFFLKGIEEIRNRARNIKDKYNVY